jgi:hypothetical protein
VTLSAYQRCRWCGREDIVPDSGLCRRCYRAREEARTLPKYNFTDEQITRILNDEELTSEEMERAKETSMWDDFEKEE